MTVSKKDKKNDFRFAFILAVIAALGFIAIMLFDTEQPPSVTDKTQQTALPKPQTDNSQHTAKPQQDGFDVTKLSRYAFITDRQTSQLAILDLYQNKVIETIELKVIPQLTAISRQADYLWYAAQNSNHLYRLDLSTLEQQNFELSQKLQTFTVSANGQWIAYQGEQNIIALNAEQQQEQPLPSRGKSSLMFLPNREALLIAELSNGRVSITDLAKQTTEQLFDRQQKISEISIMPNLMAFFFTSENRLFRYSLLDEKLTEHNFKVANKRPYITSESRKLLLFGEDQTNLQVINTYTLKPINSITINQPPTIDNQILTGWLEQTAVIAEQNALQSADLTTKQNPKITPLNAPIIDMAIQADSKTLLITTANSSTITGFDMRQQKITNQAQTQLKQPNQVIMGQTNRLCH